MIKIKNICPGILIIPDAGLKLTSGEVVSIDEHTRQIKNALASGFLTEVKDENSKENQTPENSAPAVDLSKLDATEAISKVKDEANPATLRSYMENEKRRSVLDTLKTRLAEVESAAS